MGWGVRVALYGSTLYPLFLLRTGWLALLFLYYFVPFQHSRPPFERYVFEAIHIGGASLLATLFFGFLIWPGRFSPYVPTHSILLLAILVLGLAVRVELDVFLGPIGSCAKDAPFPQIICYARKLDAIGLVLLAAWLWRKKGVIGERYQIRFHWLLFACLAWALAVLLSDGPRPWFRT